MQFPTVEKCSPALAAGVTDRIWARVRLRWEWLGGPVADSQEHLPEPADASEVSRAA
jgi:hypothetical protein